MKYDVIIIGAGLAGLVTATELIERGKTVLLLDQEGEQSLGGQAFWSFGGVFLVDSPEQKRLGVKDSFELAWKDWRHTAGFDRVEDEDSWAIQWAHAYVEFATHKKYTYLKEKGVRFFPVVGWAERGAMLPGGYGNSVPRFHITWGTGPGLVEPFKKSVLEARNRGQLTYLARHQVTELIMTEQGVCGVRGNILVQDTAERGKATSRAVVRPFHYHADAVVIASGGIGANLELVRQNWPDRLGKAPETMIAGVPNYVDGKMLELAEKHGARIVNKDRMWHYTEGLRNFSPIWDNHGIRILPGPSSLWLDAEGNRFEAPNYPGFDTLSTLEAIGKTGYDYSWFILTEEIIEKEFALSGSEQNPDLTNKRLLEVLQRVKKGAPKPVQSFIDNGVDFVVADGVKELVAGMNNLVGNELLDFLSIKEKILSRDDEIVNKQSTDPQIQIIYHARRYIGDKIVRVAKPHKLLSPASGKLIAVRLNILTRKTLGGLQTNLNGAVLDQHQNVVNGLYAVGEAAGFGGGGIHGYRSLEGTFLGSCIFTGYTVGRAIP
ncbi:FAD-binding dehydrogenase [Kurthia sp. 3B1D]|uniref:FAD-binding dehydrogenase n=1 Tax=Candidatus Kurthia intestinigallinarum TaxID=1562256 RepID=A0A433RWC4_9BACL|nr:FAD-binding dehydrogenase [Kurthia sp. 3B1D]RUS57559.1 FAD-binding dehydrogenase [Kurthia sp. 3B1D]